MKTIKKVIKVNAYKDNAGKPCCARNFSKGIVCPFYRTKKFGTIETCVFADDNVRLLRRGDDGDGTLIPLDNCPVWNVKGKS